MIYYKKLKDFIKDKLFWDDIPKNMNTLILLELFCNALGSSVGQRRPNGRIVARTLDESRTQLYIAEEKEIEHEQPCVSFAGVGLALCSGHRTLHPSQPVRLPGYPRGDKFQSLVYLSKEVGV